MSLNVYLNGPVYTEPCTCECGHVHSRERREVYFNSGITHNLTRMADAAGLYEALWRPEEIGITRAEQLIAPLEAGLKALRADLAKFRAFDAPNGWGKYEDFVLFVAEYLAACKEHPDANVSVWR